MSPSQFRFLLLALFLVVVAVVLFAVSPGWRVVVVVMALAYVLTFVIEFAASRRARRAAAAGMIVLSPEVERAPEPARARRGGRTPPAREPPERAPTPPAQRRH